MFGISLFELVVVLMVALLAFGPERLPEIARTLGKFAGQLRRSTDAVRREFYNAVYTPAEEVKRELELASKALRTMPGADFDFPKDPLCPDSEPKHDCPDCAAAEAKVTDQSKEDPK